MIKDFKYKVKQMVLKCRDGTVFLHLYNKYGSQLQNNCIYDEFMHATIRLDFKEMSAYLYLTDGIDFYELMDYLGQVSGDTGNSYVDLDVVWEVVHKQYEISFTTNYNIDFCMTDKEGFMQMDEDGTIHLCRTKYDKPETDVYGVIAPFVQDIRDLFLTDFQRSGNKLLEKEFLDIMDAEFQKELCIGEKI